MTMRVDIHLVTACIAWLSIINAVSVPVIVEHPSSLQLQVHEAGSFSCAADECELPGCYGRWRVNGSYTHNFIGEPMEEFTSKGFVFLDEQADGDKLTLTILVYASKPIGNTTLSCEFSINRTVQSENAILSVIPRKATTETTDAPTQPTATVNASIVMNSTHVSLAWFPHSLWPGHIINYYNVSFANTTDGSTTHNQIYGNPGSEIVYYAKQIPDHIWTCTEFTFAVSAVNTSGFTLQKFNISSYIAATKILFSSATINSTVLYKSDGTVAHVDVYVDLPKSICNFQELNYTLVLEEESGQLVTIVGPIQKFGPGVVKETIVSKLKRNKVYSLKARVDLRSESATSYRHYFNTSPTNWDASTPFIVNEIIGGANQEANAYKAATGVSISIAVVMLLALIVVIIVYIWNKQRGIDRKCDESKQRVCQTMVPNPIYDGDGLDDEDGPVYDSVRPQYETLVAVQAPVHPRVTPADEGMHHQASSVTETSHNNDTDVVRYVDPPIQLPRFRSQSFSHTVADPDGGGVSKSYSVSSPPSRLMAVKKNGEERNKLHLTLDLGESEDDYSEALPIPSTSSRGTAAEPLDESYMVMNSASVLSSLQNVG